MKVFVACNHEIYNWSYDFSLIS